MCRYPNRHNELHTMRARHREALVIVLRLGIVNVVESVGERFFFTRLTDKVQFEKGAGAVR